jgi:predicted RNase H-like HicB family nuclease
VATYQVDVELERWPEGGFRASAPALQGCWVVADTPEQALADIYEGIEMHIAARLRRGEPLPPGITLEAGGPTTRMRLAVAVT